MIIGRCLFEKKNLNYYPFLDFKIMATKNNDRIDDENESSHNKKLGTR